MTKFGAYLSNAATPVDEQYFQVTVNMGLTVAGENIFSMGGYTMPFAGHLHVELYAELSHPGDQAPPIWLSVGGQSSPPPSGTSDIGPCQPAAGVFTAQHEVRTHAYWANLAAGAGVNGIARIYTTVANTVTLAYLGGFWRPVPL